MSHRKDNSALEECVQALRLCTVVLANEATQKIPVIRVLEKSRDALNRLEIQRRRQQENCVTNPIDKIAFWLARKFSFKTLFTIAMVVMFVAGAIWGSLLEKLL